MIYFIVWIICAVACASIAAKKNRSALGWALAGILFGPFALVILLLMPVGERGNYLCKCPHCAEFIKPEATVCRYCGRDVVPADRGRKSMAGGKRHASVMVFCPGCQRRVSAICDECPMCGAQLHEPPAQEHQET